MTDLSKQFTKRDLQKSIDMLSSALDKCQSIDYNREDLISQFAYNNGWCISTIQSVIMSLEVVQSEI